MAKLSGGRLAAARAFKVARGQKGVSQTTVARAAGLAREVVNRFETGKTWPDAMTQVKLEPVVGMPAGELERIAASYSEQPDLIDEEMSLRERLIDVQRRLREGPSYPSRDQAARIRELEERIARDGAELQRLRSRTPESNSGPRS